MFGFGFNDFEPDWLFSDVSYLDKLALLCVFEVEN
jgi:hypothetical protein